MASTALRFALVVGLGLVPTVSDAMPTPTTKANPTSPKPTSSKKKSRPETTSTDDARRIPPRAPKPLPLAKRLARVNTLVTQLGHEKLTKLDDVQPVTLRTPELENGAKLLHAGNVSYQGPRPEAPDGLFWLHDRGMADQSIVGFSWPTEVGKLYVIDCAVKVGRYDGGAPSPSDKLEFDVDGLPKVEQPIAGGHAVHAFIAIEESSYVRTQFHTDPDRDFLDLAWYGCELAPAS